MGWALHYIEKLRQGESVDGSTAGSPLNQSLDDASASSHSHSSSSHSHFISFTGHLRASTRIKGPASA